MKQVAVPNHKGHTTYDAPEILGTRCSCGATRFGTRFGLAEHDPARELTFLVLNGDVLWEG
jgi:hypothetical protein